MAAAGPLGYHARMIDIKRLVRNVRLDLRYGSFLGGMIPTSYAHLGAEDVGNSDYAVLPALFAGRIQDGDVLVDVGCGKGRVLNWWLAQGLDNRIVGLELDAAVAARTARRLRRYENVRIEAGDAIANLPADGNVFYLFNPFKKPVVERFVAALKTRLASGRRLVVVYYNCRHLDVFENDPAWRVERAALPGDGFHAAAIVTPARAACS